MTAPVLHTPTDELVAIAWLKSALALEQVATSLPNDWTGSFVRVQSVGGDMNAVGVRRPVVTAEVWTKRPGTSGRVPWGEANTVAEDLVTATLGTDGHGHVGRMVLISAGTYRNAYVGSVSAVTRPLRIEDPTPGLARYDVNFTMQWVAPLQ